MQYQLFVGKDCHDCQKVIDYIEENNLNVEIIDLDEDNATQPPVDIFVRPALFVGNELKAYGVDIIAFIKQNN
ncbi:MAG: glutaredoxin domain-containing protein [Salibacter sp.]|uniref:glutaredoxin domain-containing protein n=1 Tax=Salibacter sp. TaxID=2010995 RepID=UPI002870AB3B|nr:glutaredoxin domain-containing protein [Salibacter sp.]MDR9399557.1 glutaredoxin domain-containing protein [Salibacter sp.]